MREHARWCERAGEQSPYLLDCNKINLRLKIQIMKRIGLLSDTHGYVDDRILVYLSECDQIWHAGDIGNVETAQKFSAIKPFKAVCGNID